VSLLPPCPPPLYAPNTPLADLRTAELLLVAALRLWMAPYRDPGSAAADWRAGFEAGGIDADGMASFDGLFRIVATTPRRALDVRCPRCAALGRDEGWLLQLIGMLQHGRLTEGTGILGDWLPMAPVRAALPVALTLARSFAVGGLMLPLRHVDAAMVSHRAPASADRGMLLLH
jgi:hypothetical protein